MPTTQMYRNRRLLLMGLLSILGVAMGFVWGRMVGYEQGKVDTIREIEQKLTKPTQETVPTKPSTVV